MSRSDVLHMVDDAKVDTNPCYVEVDSELEFSRMVCALERVPRIAFMHEHNGFRVLSIQMDLLKEKPIIYYVPMSNDGQYISYGIRGGREECSMTDSVTDSSRLYSPIVSIKSLPDNLKAGNGTNHKYWPLELDDLASLAKLTYNFDESAISLFMFPARNKWVIGVFMNFNEEGPSYFCHVMMESDPRKAFLKYTATNGTKPELVDTPSEHGYSYIKIIRLKDTHPLVDYAKLQN